MRIRWENVFAVILLVALIYLIAKHGKHVEALVATSFSQEGFQPQNQVVSLMVFGLILVLIVAIVRILVSRRE